MRHDLGKSLQRYIFSYTCGVCTPAVCERSPHEKDQTTPEMHLSPHGNHGMRYGMRYGTVRELHHVSWRRNGPQL